MLRPNALPHHTWFHLCVALIGFQFITTAHAEECADNTEALFAQGRYEVGQQYDPRTMPKTQCEHFSESVDGPHTLCKFTGPQGFTYELDAANKHIAMKSAFYDEPERFLFGLDRYATIDQWLEAIAKHTHNTNWSIAQRKEQTDISAHCIQNQLGVELDITIRFKSNTLFLVMETAHAQPGTPGKDETTDTEETTAASNARSSHHINHNDPDCELLTVAADVPQSIAYPFPRQQWENAQLQPVEKFARPNRRISVAQLLQRLPDAVGYKSDPAYHFISAATEWDVRFSPSASFSKTTLESRFCYVSRNDWAYRLRYEFHDHQLYSVTAFEPKYVGEPALYWD